jgi:hypothetical protein
VGIRERSRLGKLYFLCLPEKITIVENSPTGFGPAESTVDGWPRESRVAMARQRAPYNLLAADPVEEHDFMFTIIFYCLENVLYMVLSKVLGGFIRYNIVSLTCI